jgi:L-Ala-D/L-Glu epimerase
MQVRLQAFTLQKRHALTISRGTTSQSTNLLLRLEHEGITGWGEASPLNIGEYRQTTDALALALQKITPLLTPYHPLERQQIERILDSAILPSAARSAIDLALYDWLGKRVELPLWQLWGHDRTRIVPTSVTIGISSPEAAQARVWSWLGKGTAGTLFPGIQVLKVKLGSPAGIAADQAMLLAVQAAAPHISKISVDANGGWNLEDAITMSGWLADRGIASIEQPLAKGQEGDLLALHQQSPLPIFADESCFTSRDIPALADRVHGINIKLNKCGGLTEAMRMIATARAWGLKVMFGCYSDSTLMNTALAHLSPLADEVDLDSHLNLSNDPFVGATFQNGRVMPNDEPGLGVSLRPVEPTAPRLGNN